MRNGYKDNCPECKGTGRVGGGLGIPPEQCECDQVEPPETRDWFATNHDGHTSWAVASKKYGVLFDGLTRADAHLVAAAPDLLYALELALPHIQCDNATQSGIVTACGEAITKTKGDQT